MRVRQHHATFGLLGGHAELVGHAAKPGRLLAILENSH
jgi:hypothetical protein